MQTKNVHHLYALPVKSVSSGSSPALGFFSHVQAAASRFPQAQVDPVGVVFSVSARSHVHSPAARRRHEHLGPVTVFSAADLSQLHWSWEDVSRDQEWVVVV